MTANPFASFNVEIPKKYQESVKKYCRTDGGEKRYEYSPFERQVDFWFMAFLIATHKHLEPIKEKETYNATTGAIFSTDSKRVIFMQLSILGITKNFDILANDRAVFDHCLRLANAGIPYLLQILIDQSDKPLWSILEEIGIWTQT